MQENPLEKKVEMLENRLKDFDNRILEMEGRRSPDNVYNQIDDVYNRIETMTTNIDKILQRINTFNLDDKYVEIFSNEDLKNFYEQSGLSLPEIKQFVEKFITKENIDESTAYRYVVGEIKELRCRSKIGKFLREAAIIEENK
jgi:hypothetical protein